MYAHTDNNEYMWTDIDIGITWQCQRQINQTGKLASWQAGRQANSKQTMHTDTHTPANEMYNKFHMKITTSVICNWGGRNWTIIICWPLTKMFSSIRKKKVEQVSEWDWMRK